MGKLATVEDIILLMESVAPAFLAEDWDNSGLQAGQRDWEVKSVWVALDPTPETAAAACQANADMLITHHPLIFKPLKSVDFKSPVGSVLRMSVQNALAVYSAHTNLDAADQGVNDVLAAHVGLENVRLLTKNPRSDLYKLAVFVPSDHELPVSEALFDTNAGRIGNYSCCTFRTAGKGTFRPGDGANPYIGSVGRIHHADEVRIETVVLKKDLKRVVEAVRKRHPYETMAYDVYPIVNPEDAPGIGRIGDLHAPADLRTFANQVREKLGLNSVKVAGRPDLHVTKAAVCAGSGSSLFKKFLSSGAQVYISGDMHYHHAQEAEAAGFGIIDIGHFASEHLIVRSLADRLRNLTADAGFDIGVTAYDKEKDPFRIE